MTQPPPPPYYPPPPPGYPYGPPPPEPPKKKRYPVVWAAATIFVVGIVGSILADNFGGSADGADQIKIETSTNPQRLAGTLEISDDPTLQDPSTYRTLDDAEFKKVMFPSGDLEEYPYPFIDSRIVIYGEVGDPAQDFNTTPHPTYFEATVTNNDLFGLQDWSLDSKDVAIVGTKADLGEVKRGDAVEIFAEVRRPYLTGEEVFDHPLRDPFLVAHIVRVHR